MSAMASVWGRLGQDPRRINTSSGTPMVVASVAVDLADQREGDAPPEWFGLVAFGTLADVLAKHAKGETLAASGRLQRRSFTGSDGQQRTQLQLIADSIVSARATRPGATKGKAGGSGQGGQTKRETADRAQRECISVSGRLTRRSFTGKDGEGRTQFQVIADSLVSARSVRPGGGKPKGADQNASKRESAARSQRPLDGDRPPWEVD